MINEFQIKLPDDEAIREKLLKKMQEYEKRVRGLKKKLQLPNPEMSYKSIPGFKALIARKLYHQGEVNTRQIAKELTEEYGKLDDDQFNLAASVIQDYCDTGGKKVKQGTGF